MTKQELLKQYPDLVKEISGELLSKLVERESDTTRRFEKTFKKYVKEQVKPEWTILSIKHDTGAHEVVSSDSLLDQILALIDDYGFKIHSVRRESDGEIFTVGDYIEWQHVKGIKYISITAIQRYNNSEITFASQQNDALSYSTHLLYAVKAKPLFTTEDGLSVLKPGTYPTIRGESFQLSKEYVDSSQRAEYLMESSKIFSTFEAAEEYILMNKPVISVQILFDYIKGGGAHTIEDLKGLAKSKINAT